MKYHWKIILQIIHLNFNDYLFKYFHWHLSDIWLSLQGISYISLKFQHSFQTVYLVTTAGGLAHMSQAMSKMKIYAA